MKNPLLASIAIAVLGVAIGVLIVKVSHQLRREYSPKIDPPEEWRAISTDSLHPDTMTLYRKGDTLIPLFILKHKIRILEVAVYSDSVKGELYDIMYIDNGDTLNLTRRTKRECDSLVEIHKAGYKKHN